ncbi:Disulfide bond formation protein D precursor [Roseivivax jejudonensis]|uniref:Disulfide bond formation protein D n=1 Tax=Roseivivax jejudonensis TaxID=1529041 RepID=A0A1X6ZSG0_9RHOB|nr:DsbA family protein [Roseivivax jejudonensis]SLN60406.1 Disulfide bond formation protein D precursor [Roseivivax jejudonensis]
MTRIILPAALAAVLVGGGFWALSGAGTSWTAERGASAPVLPGAAAAQEGESVEIEEMTLGSADAPVEVIEYASFTCPHCASFHEQVFDELKENYIDTGRIKFTMREVYFDKYGIWASAIARCNTDTERFFGITDMLYESQSDWARAGSESAIADELRKIGRLAGIEGEELEACMNDGDKLRSLVGWYQENATEDDITSTPSFIIDGEKYSNMTYADFSEILDEKLASAE